MMHFRAIGSFRSFAVNAFPLCKHNPVELDESPNTAAPSLVVCSICGEVLSCQKFSPARQNELDLAEMAVHSRIQ